MMASFQHTKISAGNIAQFNDAELDQYLEVNGRCIHVDDPENLPDHFILRLRARAGDTFLSRPVDLNCVSARLVEEPVREASPSSSLGTTVALDEEEYQLECVEKEVEYYNKLVDDGGRPSHPISLDYATARNSKEYREILLFWHTSSSDPYAWMVFSRQLCKWELFRQHQQYVREQGRFSAYCQRLHDRLAKHGFMRSFRLNKELERQDRLATWIEFLNYEYWKYDKSTNVVNHRQSRHDESWKKLVDSQVLEPFETEELLWDFTHTIQLQGEESQAQGAVTSATSAMKLADQALQAQYAGVSKQPLSQTEQKLLLAKSNPPAATRSLEQISRRRKLIHEFKSQTKSYNVAKNNQNEQNILLQWILQQVPLIELEFTSAEVPRSGQHQRNLKRNRTDDDDGPFSKRHRRDGDKSLPGRKRRACTIRETSSTQTPRRTSYPDSLASKSRFKRALCLSKTSYTTSGSKSSMSLTVGVTKGTRRKN